MITICLNQENVKLFRVLVLLRIIGSCGFFLTVSQVHSANHIHGGFTNNVETRVVAIDKVIEITGGLPKGTNLFHSFNNFSVRPGEIVKFSNDTGGNISNILSRVTGGIRSSIEGTIQINQASGFENTNFFLMNSAGVVFGEGAVLHIEGSVHITTANFLGFKDGKYKFYTDPAKESSFTMFEVETFGFLSIPKPIEISNNVLKTEVGKTFSLVGSDITITNSTLKSESGHINLVSLASKGEVSLLRGQAIGPDLSEFSAMGTIKVDQRSKVDVSSSPRARQGQGLIFIRGGKLFLGNSSSLLAINESAFEGEQTSVNINIKGDIELTNKAIIATSIRGDPFSEGPNAGEIRIIAKDKLLINNSSIESVTRDGGNGGNINLEVNELAVINGAEINNDTIGAAKILEFPGLPLQVPSGKGGMIYLHAKKNILISDNSRLNTSTGGVAASSGNIEIKAPNLDLDGGVIQATSTGEGNSGNIALFVDKLNVRKGGAIVNTTTDTGVGGKVLIRGQNGAFESTSIIDISGKSSEINSSTKGSSDGGVIDLKVNVIRLSEGASISSESTGSATGNAGKIILSDVNQLTVSGGAQISSASSTTGDAGEISITGKGKAILSSLGSISSKSTGLGNAGNIKFKISELQLDNSNITTEAIQADGGNITIEGNSPSKLVSLNNDSAITATVGGGAQTTGGNINIDSDLIVVQNSNIIAEASEGIGGNIDIKTQGLFVDPDSRISASSQLGVDGTVEIDSDIQVLDGVLGLPETYVSNLRLRQKRCAQRLSGGKSSSLTTVEKSGMAMGPETLVSGDYSTYFKNKTQLGKAPQNIKNLALLDEQYDFNCRN